VGFGFGKYVFAFFWLVDLVRIRGNRDLLPLFNIWRISWIFSAQKIGSNDAQHRAWHIEERKWLFSLSRALVSAPLSESVLSRGEPQYSWYGQGGNKGNRVTVLIGGGGPSFRSHSSSNSRTDASFRVFGAGSSSTLSILQSLSFLLATSRPLDELWRESA
jgi:hypothetical protein